jgi:hypothetical protein
VQSEAHFFRNQVPFYILLTMADLAQAALHCVFDRHAGGLQTFETDAITRLMTADRIVRLMYAEVERIWQERGLDDHDTVCIQSIDPLFSRTAVKLLALAPDYISADYRGIVAVGPGYHYHHNEVIQQFRHGIYDRKRESIWERFRRAQLLITDFSADITNRFPDDSRPGLTAIQFRHHLHTPSGVVELSHFDLP